MCDNNTNCKQTTLTAHVHSIETGGTVDGPGVSIMAIYALKIASLKKN